MLILLSGLCLLSGKNNPAMTFLAFNANLLFIVANPHGHKCPCVIRGARRFIVGCAIRRVGEAENSEGEQQSGFRQNGFDTQAAPDYIVKAIHCPSGWEGIG
jgi:hypothetical protein